MDFSQKSGLSLLLALVAASPIDAATVENVRAAQRPRSNVVEVFYDLVAPEGGVYDVALAIGGGGVEPPISTLSGDWGPDIIPGRNKKIEWDAGADWAQHVGSNFIATVTATRSDADTGPSKGMVRIPGGTNEGVDPDFGAYSITVESFYMDKTEVTYAHWKRVYSWAIAHGYQFDNAGSGKGSNHPVQTVNWYDCAKWCNARSEMEGRSPAYRVNGAVYRTGQREPEVDLEGSGYRLPNSIEWQYAARGGLHGKRFPWGDIISHSHANYCGNSYSFPSYDKSSDYHPHYTDEDLPYTSPVASFAANGYGLYDMAGNVSEWETPESDFIVSIMGGSFMNNGYNCRCNVGDWHDPSYGYDYVGFRAIRRR